MKEIYMVDGQPYEVGPDRLEAFLAEFPNAVKQEAPGKTNNLTEAPTVGGLGGKVGRRALGMASKLEPTLSESQSINHLSIDEMKEGQSWLQAEGDFVKKMNKWSLDEGTGVIFDDAIGGTDAFTMYDPATDETSEAIRIPNVLGQSYHEGYGIKSWENVQSEVKGFFDRTKKIDPKFQEEKTKATNKISEWLESEDNLETLLGEDVEYRHDDKDDENDYAKVERKLKEQIGKFGGLSGGSFSPSENFNSMSEQSVEAIIKNAVTKKYESDKEKKDEVDRIGYINSIKEDDTTESIIDETNKKSKINKLSREGAALYKGIEKIKDMDPDSSAYKEQHEKNKQLLKDYDGWWKRNSEFLVDPITGASINPESPEAATAVVITSDDMKDAEDTIKQTYGQNLEQAFNVNGRKQWYSDKQGEETFNVTMNDPQALSVFKQLGYKVLGDNKLGYEMEIKKKDLSRYYDATVKSDGFTFASGLGIGGLGVDPKDVDRVGDTRFDMSAATSFQGLFGISDKSSFKSPQGYFGLTEKTDKQKFTTGEQMFYDQDEYAKDDKSKGFKRMLKDYRDDRFELIKQGKVLTKMHLLNIDPASTENLLPTRGAELIAEGFKGIFGGSAVDTDVNLGDTSKSDVSGESTRSEKDLLEGIAANSDIKLTTTQEEAIKRSGVYRVYEGVTGFVPAIAEFALIDLAIKKGVGIVPGAAKLVSKLGKGSWTKTATGAKFVEATTLQKTLYHTGGLIKEELKMRQAFDEHYHLGGGAGFYAVGNLMPNFNSKYNLLNTFMNANKSGLGGALSTQAAANLEALAKDIGGGQSYKTFVKDKYEGKLADTSIDMLVDYFTFVAVGGKGWAGRKNAFKTTSKMEKIQADAGKRMRANKAIFEDGVSSKFAKEQARLDHGVQKEIFDGVTQTLNGIYKMNDWHDPVKASKLMNDKIGKNLRKVFANEKLEIEVVNDRKDKDGNDLFDFPDSNAEYKDNKIIIDANRAEPGTIPHEVFHHVADNVFNGRDGIEKLNIFKRRIEKDFEGVTFDQVEVRDKDGKPTGEKKDMNIEELVMNEHGSQKNFDDIKANEFLAYVGGVLANPTYYSKLTAKNTWGKIKQDINMFTNRHLGQSVFTKGTKQDLIDFMANYSVSAASGKLTRKQVDMFKKIKDGKIFAEGIEADSRTEKRKNEESSKEEMKRPMPSKSVELSGATQKAYDLQVKGKEGRQLDRGIESLIAPGSNKGSVAGKHFDDIIYELVNSMKGERRYSEDQKYTLALDMVYDLNRSEGTKNRGVQGILKEYANRKSWGVRTVIENGKEKEVKDIYEKDGHKRLKEDRITKLEEKYEAKFGTPEFIKEAEKEGYKGKQNVTKTVREGLIKRIHEIEGRAFDKESDFAELGHTESVQEMGETGRELIDKDVPDLPFEFKSREDKALEDKKQTKINVKDYVPARDLVSVKRVTTDILKSETDLIGLRPKIVNKTTKKLQPIVEKQFGRVTEVKDKDGNITYEKVARKDYYDIQKEIFESKEKELYKIALPENRDRNTSEANMIAKTAFDRLYKESGEFSYADLNKGTPRELLTDSQKKEHRKKFGKEPYRKGILTDIIYEGNRKDVHHSRADILMPYMTSRLAEKVMIDQLNNPRYAAMLKEMNPGVYEGLQLESIVKSIQENLRGMSDKGLAQKGAKLKDNYGGQLLEKIREGTSARPALLEIIAQNPELKKHKKKILSDMDLDIKKADTVDKVHQKVGETGRLVGDLGPAFKPLPFKDYKAVNKDIREIVGTEVADKLDKREHSKRREDIDFSRKYAEEFLPEWMDTHGSDIIKEKGALQGYSVGEGVSRYGYRKKVDHIDNRKQVKDKKTGELVENPTYGKVIGKRFKIFDAEMREGIIEGVEGIKGEKHGINLDYVKSTDSGLFKKAAAKILVESNTNSASGRLALANTIAKKLSPDKTVEGYNKMEKNNEKMLKYESEKVYDFLENAKSKGVDAYANAINHVSFMLQGNTSSSKGIWRSMATHNAVTTNIAEKYHSEHELQLTWLTGNVLVGAVRNSGNKDKFMEELNPLVKMYRQSIIEKSLQETIDKDGNTTNRMSEKGVDSDQMAKGEFLRERITMESTLHIGGKNHGKTYAEIIDNLVEGGAAYKALQAVNKKLTKQSKEKGLPSKNVTTTEMLRNMRIHDKALNEGKKRKKKARGMSTWDFDDTLARTKSGVRYTLPNPSGKPAPGKKAIFLAGGPGAGKSNVVKQLGLEKQGFKIVNQDISLEWLAKNHGLPKNMKDFTSEQASKWSSLQWEAMDIAQRKKMKFQGRGDGVVIDGTGQNKISMSAQMNEFQRKGYDVQMIFVETSKDVALKRNQERKERSLKDFVVERTHDNVMKNKDAFKEFFGDRFAEINTDKLKQGDPMPKDLIDKLDGFTKGYIKGRLNAGEFAGKGAELKEQGAEFDFAEFNIVKEGEKGPFFQKALDRAKKFGLKDQFVLTARPPESQIPIYEFLKAQGLEIPLKNITGLGNSTAEAKALWMLEKFSEGYNDMYFADDAMQNVKAVKDVLSQLDIKSNVQQALAQKNYSLELNGIMNHSLGIDAEKKFSTAEGKMRGKDKKRRKFFMTDSASDLELLMEPLYGKGKEGTKNKEWFEKEFYKPWEKGVNDLNTARQTILNDYMGLRKQNKDIVKSLDKAVEGTNFTNDMAARVYIWNKAGFEAPGLTKTSKAKLLEHVANNPKLQAYAESVARLTKIETGLKEPKEEWWAETLASEVSETGRTVNRDKYIGDWIQRKNEMFSKENMAKMESELGPKWRESVENMFYRMETGTTRTKNLGRIGNNVMNYLNGSVGAIMNLNTRSATLQLISSVNFINHAENNPLKAAAAFANQPQYWKDFMTIMNSDMLKQRRDGLQINVTEAELAAAVDGKGNKAKKAIAYILKQGYIPTKIADSFAISSGGATYYRNRAKKYQKEGLSLKEAEAKAFVDFQAIAEKTQQSSRPDLLSQQQTSFEGRLLLPFANTPMQMNRIMMKEMLDLSKGRYKGSFGENSITNKMSKIAYYGAVQSAIFAGLQTGLFALMANSDDDEIIAQKKVRAYNTMADSFLRGMGIPGVVASGVKNAGMKFYEQNQKGFGADYSEVAEALLNMSPTIGSKFSKLDAAGNTYLFNKKEILEKGFSLDNTKAMEAGATTVEAITNIPIARVIRKTENIKGMLDEQNEAWQRFMMGLGWSGWDVGVDMKKEKKNESEEIIYNLDY